MSITLQNQTDVASLYVALFGRAPEGAGMGYWVDQLGNKGVPMATMAQQMYATPDAVTYYPAYYTNDQIVQSFYLNVLGRVGDATGQAYWVAQLGSGSSPGKVISDMIMATNTYSGTDVAALGSKALFANKTSVALAFGSNVLNFAATQDSGKAILSTVTSDAATATAAIASVAVVTGSTFVLSTSLDTLTGTAGNDIFIANNGGGLNSATSTSDAINGGAGVDTLRLFLQTGAGIGTVLPAMTSIEKLVVINADVGVTSAGALNVSAITGLTSLEVDGQAAGTAMTYTLKAQSFQLDNTALAAVDVIVAGAADTTQSVTLNAVTSTAAGGIDLRGAALVSATISSTGGASTIGATGQLSNTVGGLITTLNLAGDRLLTLTESAQMASAVTTINASTDIGGVTVDTSTGAKKAAFAFTGGAGNDKIILAAGDLSILTSGAQLNGGAGTDTLVIKDVAPAAADYTAMNASVGFEILGLGVSGMSVDASQMTGAMAKHFTIGAMATETISKIASGTVVDLNAAMTKLTLTPVPFAAQSGATVNLNTSAAATGFTLGTLSVSGLGSTQLASAGNNSVKNIISSISGAENATLLVSGANDLTFALAAGVTTGTKVDASAFAANLNVTGSSLADVIIGGAGADTIQGAPANVANQADTLTGGGGADTFVFSGSNIANLMASSAGTTAVARITDFLAGTDKISLVDGTAAFTGMTLASAQTLSTAASLSAVYAGITPIGASTQGGAASGVVITVAAGAAAGTYLYVNDATAGVSNTADMLINITGITGTLAAADFGLASGGSGSSFNLTTATDTLTGTPSNDTFVGTYDGGVVTDTFSAADTIAGGGGTDTLSITHSLDGAITPPDAIWANVSAVKTLVIDATGAGAQTITTGTNFNTAFAGGANLTVKTTSGAITIDMNTTPFTGAASITALTSISGAQTITTGSGATSVSVTQHGTGAQTILTTATATAVTVNATNDGTGGAQSITTGAGNDTINLVSSVVSAAATIIGGAGADAISLFSGHTTGIDTITYTSATQGGNVSTIASATAMTAGDTVANFHIATDLINVNTATTGAHAAATGVAGNWSLTANTVYVLTGSYLAVSGATTAANVGTAIGNVTSAGTEFGVVAIQTAAGSGTYNLFEVHAANAHAGGALATSDTITLVGTYTLGASVSLGISNFTA